jgi:hypothetical protein
VTTLIGTKRCPLAYLEDVAISYEEEFCKLDDKVCHPDDCEVMKAMRKKQSGG